MKRCGRNAAIMGIMKKLSREESCRAAIKKEIQAVEKKEEKLRQRALRPKQPGWKQELEKKIPDQVYSTLEKAFCKAFEIVFEKGTGIIEKSYQKETIQQDRMIQEYAFQVKANRKELKKLHQKAAAADMKNMAFTTVEGIGLGVFGIGLPDIVIFVGMLLKGVYETALHYGFDYDSPEERLFILKMMEASMLDGESWRRANAEIDNLVTEQFLVIPGEGDFERQLRRTASVFAMDMLVLKFIQGLPLAGILGGAANPLYYHKVMKYVQLKYRKRYLYKKDGETITFGGENR